MAEEQRISEHMTIDLLDTQDVGATNFQNNGGWLSMELYRRAYFYVEIGTWNATDDLDECRLEQGQGSGGSNAKDWTTDESGGNYDTDNPVDADGDFVIIEVVAASLDVNASTPFDYVRAYVAEATGTGADFVTGALMRYQQALRKKELQGAAVTGSKVYVSTDT